MPLPRSMPARRTWRVVHASLAASVLRAAPAHAQPTDDLLPDVIVAQDLLGEIRIDLLSLPGGRLLRFPTSTPNVGQGRLEIRGSTVLSPNRQEVVQRIYRLDGTFWDRAAGTSTYHPAHAHIHFDDWAHYRLLASLPNGEAGDVVAFGSKTSFCLLDLVAYDVLLPGAGPPSYGTCGRAVQGISPGWADVYDRELFGQWIDITGLADGRYWLEVEVDPEDRVLEGVGGEMNNVARIQIELGPSPTASPDAFEPNDSQLEVEGRDPGGTNSPHLGLVLGRLELGGLSMEDPTDYFRFSLDREASPGAHLRIESAYLGSDLDLFLFDVTRNTFIDFSNSGGNFEQISLAGLPAGEYYALVTQYSGENPGYRLVIDSAANTPPQLDVIEPGAGRVWVERAFETLSVEWIATDPEADPVSVALFLDRDQVLDKASLAVGGYQNLAGESGQAMLNTAGLDLGTWFLFARATDGGGQSGAWAPGAFVLYVKGDLDADGELGPSDWHALQRHQNACRGKRLGATLEGWPFIMDMDRDGDVDRRDFRLFHAAVFDATHRDGPAGH